MRRCALFAILCLAGCSQSGKVGPQPDGSTLVATGQLLRPAGEQIAFTGRPVDIVVARDKQTLFVKDNQGLTILDAKTKTVRQRLPLKGGTSLHGLAAVEGGVWVSGSGSTIHRAIEKDGKYEWDKSIELPKAAVGGAAYPCGIASVANWLVVAASRDNSLYIYDADSLEKIERIPVHVAPYDVVGSVEHRYVYVSCWGGPPPEEGEKQSPSSGSPVRVDARGVAKNGSVLRVSLDSFKILQVADVALQPMQIVNMGDQKRLLVGHGNADHVTILENETMKVLGKIDAKPSSKLPYGSMPGGISISPDGKTLFTANGGDNAVGVFDIATRKAKGFIPVGWYPSSIAVHEGNLWVTNVKGIGSREARKADGKFSVYAYSGTVSVVPIPDVAELKKMTITVAEGNSQKEMLLAVERSERKLGKPVPEKLGEQSPIEHVVYIVKENRTYDQIFGDVAKGDGDPSLCIFGKEVTPNHHAIAEEFVLLDNFYCNGVLSADGHSWAMEGVVTGYLERSFGGFTRSYPYGGDDSINNAASGFIWDSVLAAGLTFRNFGEMDDATTDPKRTWTELYAEHTAGKLTTKYPKKVLIENLLAYTDPDYPGWNMDIPEQIRADIFIEKLAKMETFANFTILYLPQDHTSGMGAGQPTPQACVADNDLAMGRIVEALSKSKWWAKMAIFVVEDDPQNGFDHVDGHRSPAFVISPYVKRGSVVSKFYNQTSVLHTMTRILGLPPITQFASASPLMSDCFMEKPDLTPYVCRPATYPVDKLNPAKSEMTSFQRTWSDLTDKQDLSKMDAVDDDEMNRILWHSVMGTKPYPAEWAGAHGRGLKAKGLTIDALAGDDD